jgi:hypothetical protein
LARRFTLKIGYKIDFTKPGAECINSIVNHYASWGIHFIKLDGVSPGSYNDNLDINNIPMFRRIPFRIWMLLCYSRAIHAD